jgi:hypothetical protein
MSLVLQHQSQELNTLIPLQDAQTKWKDEEGGKLFELASIYKLVIRLSHSAISELAGTTSRHGLAFSIRM